MWNFQDLTGERFGKLTVVDRADDYVSPSGNKSTRWLCQCDCGNEKIATSANLKRGSTSSCGCLHKEKWHTVITKHGKHDSRLYRIWKGILTRCYNETNHAYKNYGGRGITMCDEWKDNFQCFYDWAMENGYTDELSIDRIDNDGNYRPDNCQWMTAGENTRKAWNDRRNKTTSTNKKEN